MRIASNRQKLVIKKNLPKENSENYEKDTCVQLELTQHYKIRYLRVQCITPFGERGGRQKYNMYLNGKYDRM